MLCASKYLCTDCKHKVTRGIAPLATSVSNAAKSYTKSVKSLLVNFSAMSLAAKLSGIKIF